TTWLNKISSVVLSLSPDPYTSPFYYIFLQNSLMQSVVLLTLEPLSEHQCLDNGPYSNSMTKCSAIEGCHASWKKEAPGSGEG
ncbi:hypothetical protein, partial [Nitratifractor sp.]